MILSGEVRTFVLLSNSLRALGCQVTRAVTLASAQQLLRASLDDASRFAEALRQGAEQLGAGIGDGSIAVSISVGVAAVEPRAAEFTHAFAAAETACKAANDRGRNRVEVFQEADESIIRRFTDINVITDLRAAISEGRLHLNAQLLLPLGNDVGQRNECC